MAHIVAGNMPRLETPSHAPRGRTQPLTGAVWRLLLRLFPIFVGGVHAADSPPRQGRARLILWSPDAVSAPRPPPPGPPQDGGGLGDPAGGRTQGARAPPRRRPEEFSGQRAAEKANEEEAEKAALA